MKLIVTRILKRLKKRGQTGQSIVILALGFVALLGFVGITVDVSLLFVRFSTLRRAVDSAVIAAAGQMREDRSLGNVSMAARQFIEFHNLDPRLVLVETCANSPDIDPDTAGLQVDPQLCTADQRKLVRVTAEIDSPTVFLRLFGFDNISLRASAISETAVLDVVLILDVSESMLNDTSVEDWAQVNQGVAYVPPRAWGNGNFFGDPAAGTNDPNTIFAREILAGEYANNQFIYFEEFWQQDLLGVPQEVVNRRLFYQQYPGQNAPAGPVTNRPEADPSYLVQYFVPNTIPNPSSQFHPREECRVRFFPYSQSIPRSRYIRNMWQANSPSINTNFGSNNWGNFVPTFDFYGCCNDPGNGTIDNQGNITPGNQVAPDRDFSDLVCEPFKSARDATRLFLERIDFVRGDRVGFVTFDRTAFIIDPDGTAGTPTLNQTHMIENYGDAVNTLNRLIGVRAEPNFYNWDEVNGGWTSFAQGLDQNGQSIVIDYYSPDSVPVVPGDGRTNPISYNDYPAKDNCPFQNAAMFYPFSRYAIRGVSGELFPGYPFEGLPGLYNIMTPDIVNNAEWRLAAQNANPPLDPFNSYELWASCRNGNIGAGLREGNNALTDPATTRREGTVWVMIMMSDGATGASDPARRGGFPATPAQPYVQVSQYNPATNPVTPQIYGLPGQYGAFGVCPYGTPSDFGELTATEGESPVIFPYCMDEEPQTRHFCYPQVRALNGGDSTVGFPNFDEGFGPGALDRNYDFNQSFEWNVANGHVFDLDVGNYPNVLNCDLFYDVDDYARDWADFVGRVFDETGDNSSLPTIFTIGFGINFELGNGSCQANIPDCLGEELLRYIADVGDNFKIDIDYQQDWLDNGLLDNSLLPEDYGPPGICEAVGADYPTSGTIEFLTPGESCGNYFNAPGAEELNIVFDEIASRLFTRLAG